MNNYPSISGVSHRHCSHPSRPEPARARRARSDVGRRAERPFGSAGPESIDELRVHFLKHSPETL